MVTSWGLWERDMVSKHRYRPKITPIMSHRKAWFISLTILSYTQVAVAHGIQIEVKPAAIEIQATYDDGQPLANAQVQIYGPDEPETPQIKGQTDLNGQFSFVPDPRLPGDWEVTVRQAGHGGTTIVTVGDGTAVAVTPEPPTALSPVPQWLSMGAIVWGLIGTALFFARGKR